MRRCSAEYKVLLSWMMVLNSEGAKQNDAAEHDENFDLKHTLDAVLRWCCWTRWKMGLATQTWCSIEVTLIDRIKNGTWNTILMQYWGDSSGQDEKWDLQRKLDALLRWCCWTGWKMWLAAQTWCSIEVMLLNRMTNGTCNTNLMQYWGDTDRQDEKLDLQHKLDEVLR